MSVAPFGVGRSARWGSWAEGNGEMSDLEADARGLAGGTNGLSTAGGREEPDGVETW